MRAGAKAQPKKSKTGLVVALTSLAAVVGVGGYLALRGGDGRATGPEEQQALPTGAVTPPVETLKVPVVVPETVRTQAAQPARREPPRQPTRQTEVPPAAPAEVQGFLTIDADPFGTVYVDGVNVGETPVIKKAVKPGQHTIRIQREGYKTHTETVCLDAGNEIRRRITLIPEG